MKCASKFIDYFVHDILDFSILSNNETKFVHHNSIFNIQEAISEILEIQEDKIRMKNISVRIYYSGFKSNFVNTDFKRLQLVLLNLTSNAVKFTDREGRIKIMV